MQLSIEVKTGARVESVVDLGNQRYAVSVRARPQDGKANEAVIAALANHFNVAPSRISICSGHTSRKKIVEIES